jgi:hypothetical protein
VRRVCVPLTEISTCLAMSFGASKLPKKRNVVAYDVQWEDLVLGETRLICKWLCCY